MSCYIDVKKDGSFEAAPSPRAFGVCFLPRKAAQRQHGDIMPRYFDTLDEMIIETELDTKININ